MCNLRGKNISYSKFLTTIVIFSFNLSHPPVDWTIQLGMTRRSSHSYYEQKLKVQRVISHPEYNRGIPHDNDIALFQVSFMLHPCRIIQLCGFIKNFKLFPAIMLFCIQVKKGGGNASTGCLSVIKSFDF